MSLPLYQLSNRHDKSIKRLFIFNNYIQNWKLKSLWKLVMCWVGSERFFCVCPHLCFRPWFYPSLHFSSLTIEHWIFFVSFVEIGKQRWKKTTNSTYQYVNLETEIWLEPYSVRLSIRFTTWDDNRERQSAGYIKKIHSRRFDEGCREATRWWQSFWMCQKAMCSWASFPSALVKVIGHLTLPVLFVV